jgi:G3E family GTPase
MVDDFSPLKIDKACTVCNNGGMLRQIKNACLCYVASPIKYREKEVKHNDLIGMKDDLLIKC